MSLSKHFIASLAKASHHPPVLAISLSVFAIFCGPLLFVGSAQRLPDANAAAARNAALIAATNEVLKETSELRQLSIIQPVQSSTQSRTEIQRMIVKNFDIELTTAESHAAEVSLKKLGLAPQDFQYRPFMISLLSEQVAGYYDPKLRQFHLADWIDVDGQRPVMAHELTHALQDQHFNLRRFEHWPSGDSDAQMATHALVEGDATLVMALYIANNPLRGLAFLRSLSASGMSSEELGKAPRAVRESLLFPYQEGVTWTRALFRHGGWAQVSKAFTELPQSTEQILHPKKYFAHEAPVKIVIPDIAPLLNSSPGKTVTNKRTIGGPRRHHPPSSPPVWRRVGYDVQGEWSFYLLLDQFLKSPVESRRAAEGWGGDRCVFYEAPNGQVLFISLSSWDSQADAREFFDAYAKRTQLRYPDAQTVTAGDANDAASVTNIQQSWKTADGTVTLDLQGSRVLIVEDSGSFANVKLLLKRLNQSRARSHSDR